MDFCKCIEWILSEVTYGKKGFIICGGGHRYDAEEIPSLIDRYVRGKIFTKGTMLSLLFLLVVPYPLNYVILHQFINLLDVSLSTYLYPLYMFVVFPFQGSSSSRYFGRVTLPLHY